MQYERTRPARTCSIVMWLLALFLLCFVGTLECSEMIGSRGVCTSVTAQKILRRFQQQGRARSAQGTEVEVASVMVDDLLYCINQGALPFPPRRAQVSSGARWWRGLRTALIVLLCTVAAVGASALLLRYCSRLGRHRWHMFAVPAPGPDTTLVVTDIQDSTVLWEALAPEVMDAAVKVHSAIIRRQLRRFRGYESATEGDSFLLAFFSAQDAVKFAVHAQAELLLADWPEPLLEMPLCRPLYVQAAHRPRHSSHHSSVRQPSNPPSSLQTLLNRLRTLLPWSLPRHHHPIPLPEPPDPSLFISPPSSSPPAPPSTISQLPTPSHLSTPPPSSSLHTQAPSRHLGSIGTAVVSIFSSVYGARGEVCSLQAACSHAWRAVEPDDCPPEAAQLVFRGLRVRVGAHTGLGTSDSLRLNQSDSRYHYTGPAANMAKGVSDAAQGAMVIISEACCAALNMEALAGVAVLARMGHHNVDGKLDTTLYQVVHPTLLPRLALLDPPRTAAALLPSILDAPVGDIAVAAVTAASLDALRAWDRGATAASLKVLQALALEELQCYEGAYPLLAGGGEGVLMAAFTSAADAVLWAVNCQLQGLDAPWPEELLAHHLGAHTTTILDPPPAYPKFHSRTARYTEDPTTSPNCQSPRSSSLALPPPQGLLPPPHRARSSISLLVDSFMTSHNMFGGRHSGQAGLSQGGREGQAVVLRGLRLQAGVDVGRGAAALRPDTGDVEYSRALLERVLRIAATARAGQVLASESAWNAGFEAGAGHQLDGLLVPEHLGTVVLKGGLDIVPLVHCRQAPADPPYLLHPTHISRSSVSTHSDPPVPPAHPSRPTAFPPFLNNRCQTTIDYSSSMASPGIAPPANTPFRARYPSYPPSPPSPKEPAGSSLPGPHRSSTGDSESTASAAAGAADVYSNSHYQQQQQQWQHQQQHHHQQQQYQQLHQMEQPQHQQLHQQQQQQQQLPLLQLQPQPRQSSVSRMSSLKSLFAELEGILHPGPPLEHAHSLMSNTSSMESISAWIDDAAAAFTRPPHLHPPWPHPQQPQITRPPRRTRSGISNMSSFHDPSPVPPQPEDCHPHLLQHGSHLPPPPGPSHHPRSPHSPRGAAIPLPEWPSPIPTPATAQQRARSCRNSYTQVPCARELHRTSSASATASAAAAAAAGAAAAAAAAAAAVELGPYPWQQHSSAAAPWR